MDCSSCVTMWLTASEILKISENFPAKNLMLPLLDILVRILPLHKRHMKRSATYKNTKWKLNYNEVEQEKKAARSSTKRIIWHLVKIWINDWYYELFLIAEILRKVQILQFFRLLISSDWTISKSIQTPLTMS